jgi:hypothetical protein
MPNEKGTTVYTLQKKFQNVFGFTLPLFHGRGLLNCMCVFLRLVSMLLLGRLQVLRLRCTASVYFAYLSAYVLTCDVCRSADNFGLMPHRRGIVSVSEYRIARHPLHNQTPCVPLLPRCSRVCLIACALACAHADTLDSREADTRHPKR